MTAVLHLETWLHPVTSEPYPWQIQLGSASSHLVYRRDCPQAGMESSCPVKGRSEVSLFVQVQGHILPFVFRMSKQATTAGISVISNERASRGRTIILYWW